MIKINQLYYLVCVGSMSYEFSLYDFAGGCANVWKRSVCVRFRLQRYVCIMECFFCFHNPFMFGFVYIIGICYIIKCVQRTSTNYWFLFQLEFLFILIYYAVMFERVTFWICFLCSFFWIFVRLFFFQWHSAREKNKLN